MHWRVLGPYIHSATDPWLAEYVERPGRAFSLVPAAYRHDRSRAVSGLSDWRDYFSHAHQAWRSLDAARPEPGGLITIFPQLAMCAAIEKRLRRRDVPLLAWCFNLGALFQGAKGRLARFAAPAVDRWVVHSTAEVQAYSQWLGLPADRFRFVPLQRPVEPVAFGEDLDQPFLLAMGSARRDYPLLVQVVARLGVPTLIVAAEHAVQGIALPPNVTVRQGLSAAQCNELAQRARLCVVPVANRETASGQVTVIDSMMFGRATIATRCVGTVDYIDHGVDGWLVEPGSAAQLGEAIATLWADEGLRRSLGQNARTRVQTRLSDAAAGAALDALLLELEQR